ncbi:hypothetical protein OUZ56_011530 [Daphnia magna]|uniref:Fucosyltransferase n=1 Tax=Daphnia magna TaxID=35525 RepID=A0ABQ9Z0D1_9CRUS|nr:hypothetical protein OUZ56_011530 [Daphnia magna]
MWSSSAMSLNLYYVRMLPQPSKCALNIFFFFPLFLALLFIRMWHSSLPTTKQINILSTSYDLNLSYAQESTDRDDRFLKIMLSKTKPTQRWKNKEFLQSKLKIILLWNSWNSILDFPTKRNSRQRFVFFQLETPTRYNLPNILDDYHVGHGYFDWTMTYRWDSDIVYRGDYGYIVEKSAITSSGIRSRQLKDWSYRIGKSQNSQIDRSKERKNSTSMANIVKRKTKLVAWFVSHCFTHIRREEYVYQLRQYIPIDIFGACNNRDCPYDCNEMLSNDYKFYLAFENSWCPDYVTEKFYRPLMHNTVPIVMGGADYNRFAPPDSYINARDYDSPKNLAEYILFLDNTDTVYIRYFEWKKNFDILLPDYYGLCDLCRMAHDTTWPSKIYSDIKQWWVESAGCENNTIKYF